MDNVAEHARLNDRVSDLPTTEEQAPIRSTSSVSNTLSVFNNSQNPLKRPAPDEADADDGPKRRKEEATAAPTARKGIMKNKHSPAPCKERIKRAEYIHSRKREIMQGQVQKSDPKAQSVDLLPDGLRDREAEIDMEPEGRKAKLVIGEGPKKIDSDPITQQQLMDIGMAHSRVGFRFFGRTASREGGDRFDHRPSSGYTDAEILMPDAETREGFSVHASIHDLRQDEQVHMLGHHLLWTNLRGDEYFSLSVSLPFLYIHALRRYESWQEGVTIQFIDSDKTFTVDGKTPAVFYDALSLYKALGIHQSQAWTIINLTHLGPRLFTQERLLHGTARLDTKVFKPAKIEDLINDGFLDLVPELDIPEDHQRSALYEAQVAWRIKGFRAKTRSTFRIGRTVYWFYPYSYDECAKETPVSERELRLAKRLTRRFMMAGVRPHPQLVLQHLCFRKRPSSNPMLVALFKKYYSDAALLRIYTDNAGNVRPFFTHVPSNLPENMQFLDLLRELTTDRGLLNLPATVVESVDEDRNQWQASASCKVKEEELQGKTAKREKKKARKEKAARLEAQSKLAMKNAPRANAPSHGDDESGHDADEIPAERDTGDMQQSTERVEGDDAEEEDTATGEPEGADGELAEAVFRRAWEEGGAEEVAMETIFEF